jgi:hypothetical protein
VNKTIYAQSLENKTPQFNDRRYQFKKIVYHYEYKSVKNKNWPTYVLEDILNLQ